MEGRCGGLQTAPGLELKKGHAMRQEHRQGTGFFRHLPLFFAVLGVFAGGVVTAARGAEGTSSASGQPSVEVVSGAAMTEDDALLEMYFEWLLRQMRAPVPASASLHELARAFIHEFDARGTPDLKPLTAVQFVTTLMLTEAILLTNPDGIEPELADRVLEVIHEMLGVLGGTEGRVAE